MPRRVHFLLLAPLLTVAAGSGPLSSQSAPARIVAIGDIHGSADGFSAILKAANLIDDSGRWIGGTAHVVQTGDYTDRGERVRDVLEMLIQIEEEAKRAGGRAEILMGNHEVMNLLLDLRDVSPQAYAAFADGKSEDRRRRAYRAYTDVMKRGNRSAVAEAEWNTAHPLGFVEYVDALRPREKYGRWLRDRKVVVQVGGTIFMHAGLSDSTTGSLEDVNRTAEREIQAWDRTRDLLVRAELITPYFTLKETLDAVVTELQRIAAALEAKEPPGDHVTREFFQELQAATQIGRSSLMHADGPLWFRGYALWPDSEAGKIAALLERFGAERFVTAHTPIVKGITPRFDNRVFLIDTGMLSSHYTGGRPSALEITDDAVSAIYTDGRETLWKKEALSGANPLAESGGS
jgi:alkylhydroperoxidase family enzyme